MRRILSILLCIAMLLGMLPGRVMATEAETGDETPVLELRFYPDCESGEYILINHAEEYLEIDFNTTDNPYKYEILFEDPEAIGYAYVTSTVDGAKKAIDAVYDPETGLFITEGYFDPDNRYYEPEEVRVEYSYKTSAPEVGSEVDWEEMNSYLVEEMHNATVENVSEGESSTGTVNFDDTIESLLGLSMNYAIKALDSGLGTELGDVRSHYKTGENILSYVVPGVDDSRYYVYLDMNDPETLKMLVDDGNDAAGKAVELTMEFMDHDTEAYKALKEISSVMSEVSKVTDVVGDVYNVHQDMDGLRDEIASADYITEENKEIALTKVDELEQDQIAFVLMVTMLPIIATGGAAIIPAAAVFTAAIGVMSSASDSIYAYRVAGIKEDAVEASWISLADGGACSETISWEYRANTLTISGQGVLSGYSTPWAKYVNKVHTLDVEEGITYLDGPCFAGHYYLTEVSLPQSLQGISGRTFSSCIRLEELTLPVGLQTLSIGCVDDCTALKEITIPDTVTTIAGLGLPTGCPALTDIYYLGTVDQWEAIDGSDLFPSYHPGGWTTEGIWVHMENFGTFGEGFRWSFSEDNRTLAIIGTGEMPEIPKYEDTVDSRKYPWRHCASRVETIRINDGITTVSPYAFQGHTAVSWVILPDSLETIGGFAFGNCSALDMIDLPESLTTVLGHAFEECDALASIIIPDSVTRMGEDIFSGCDKLKTVQLSANAGDVSSGMFVNCDSMESIEIPEGYTDIYGSAFLGCDSLTEVAIPDSVTHIGDAAFAGCTALEEIRIPDSVTSFGEEMFQGCTALTDVTLPSGLTRLPQWTFLGCTALTDLCLNPGITSLEYGAYEDCTGLTGISIPDSVTHIGNSCFSGCTGLTEVRLTSSVRIIGSEAFSSCTSLGKINLNAVRTLESEAFYGCTALTEVRIPATVSHMESSVFGECSSLATVTFLGDAPEGAPYNIFEGVTATACYPGSNETWTAEARSDMGGNIIWVPYTVHRVLEDSVSDVAPSKGDTLRVHCDAEISGFESAYVDGDPVDAADYTLTEGSTIVTLSDDYLSTLSLGQHELVLQFADGFSRWEFTVSDGHEHRYDAVVTAPGCTEQGYTTYTCSICGENYTSDYVEPTGHSWDEGVVTLEPDLFMMGEKTYTCTVCGETKVEKIPSLTHSHSYYSAGVTLPTCTERGYTTYACICGDTYDGDFVDPLDHNYADGICSRCGAEAPDDEDPTVPTDPTEPEEPVLEGVIRIAGSDRIGTSLQLADQLKEVLSVEKFDAVVVASALNFPDALTGSYLAAEKKAPILLTYPDAHEKIVAYIEANLKDGGIVYILGGESAVDKDFEDLATAKGMKVQRVAGSDRFGTNLEILKTAGNYAGKPVLIATATGFADSLSASATGLPMLLVYGKLTDAQKAFLATTSKEFIIIGGDAAVSADLEAELDAIGDVERVAGENRYQTSVKVAGRFLDAPEAAVLAYARNFPDGLCGGPLAYALGAPLILTDNYDPSEADTYVRGISAGIVVGGTGLISDAAARAIFDLAANTEITPK